MNHISVKRDHIRHKELGINAEEEERPIGQDTPDKVLIDSVYNPIEDDHHGGGGGGKHRLHNHGGSSFMATGS